MLKNKKNKIVLFLILCIVFIPSSFAKEECEDINDILKDRWPYRSGNGYFPVYAYPLSTNLIYNYENNKDFLVYGKNPPTSKFTKSAWLKTKDNWEEGVKILLPIPTHHMGKIFYEYSNTKKETANNLKWEEYTIKCGIEEEKKFEYTITGKETLWSIWKSVREKNKISWLEFLELNKKISGVNKLIDKIKNREEATKVIVNLNLGDKVITGKDEIVEEAKTKLRREDFSVESILKSFANSNVQFFSDNQNIFPENPEADLKKLFDEKNVLVKIFTISPSHMGSLSIPLIADSIAYEIKENFIKSNPDYKIIIMILMKPDVTKEKIVEKTVSIRTFNLNIDRQFVYNSFFDAAGIDKSTQEIFSSINEIIKEKTKLLKFLDLLIKEKEPIRVETTQFKESAQLRLQKILDGHLPDTTFYDSLYLCSVGVNAVTDYIFGLGTSCELETINKDAWMYSETFNELSRSTNSRIIPADEVDFETLPPGTVLGFLNKDSKFQEKADTGSGYTHVGLYVGKGKIIHKFPKKLRMENIAEFLINQGGTLKLIEALVPPTEILNKERKYETKEFTATSNVLTELLDSLSRKIGSKPSEFGKYYPILIAEIAEINNLESAMDNVKKGDSIKIPLLKFCDVDLTLLKEAKSSVNRIIIDPGHGQTCFNGKLQTPNKLEQETELNMRFSTELRDLMQTEFNDAEIILTRRANNFDLGNLAGFEFVSNTLSNEFICSQNTFPFGTTNEPRYVCFKSEDKNTLQVRNRVHASCIQCIEENNCINYFGQCENNNEKFNACWRKNCNEFCLDKQESLNLVGNTKSMLDLGKKDPQKADFFISIHHDICPKNDRGKCHGPRVIYNSKYEDLAFELCADILTVYYENGGVKNRDCPKQDNKIAMIKESATNDIPGLILELGFMDSKIDANLVGLNPAIQQVAYTSGDEFPRSDKGSLTSGILDETSKEFREKVQKVIIKTIKEHLGEEVEEKPPVVSAIDMSDYSKIVIILDDGGHRIDDVDSLKTLAPLEVPITVAILPGCGPDTGRVAKYISDEYENSKIILHQPMQPQDLDLEVECKDEAERDRLSIARLRGIYDTSDDNEIVEYMGRVDSNINEIKSFLKDKSRFIGLNNHQGSLVTRNRILMIALASVLRGENLIFVDSFTHPNSRAFDVIKDQGVKAFKRDEFIDTLSLDTKKQLKKLENSVDAGKKDYAIGIGHVLKDTADAINQFLSENGYVLVYDSELKHKVYANHEKKIKFVLLDDLTRRDTGDVIKASTGSGEDRITITIPLLVGYTTREEQHEFSRDFGLRLKKAINEIKKTKPQIYNRFTVTSGTRTSERQEELYRNDPKITAKPGTSEHELGNAIDISVNRLFSDELQDIDEIFKKYGIVMTQPNENWHFAIKPQDKDLYIKMLRDQGRLEEYYIQNAAKALFPAERQIASSQQSAEDLELIKEMLSANKVKMVKDQRDNIDTWANAILKGMTKRNIDINEVTVGLILTFLTQETSFNPDPDIDLDRLCNNLGKIKLGVLSTVNKCTPIFGNNRGKISGKEFARTILDAKNSLVKGIFLQSVEISMGPSQIKSFRVREILAERLEMNFEDVVITPEIFDNIFTIEGGLDFGIHYIGNIIEANAPDGVINDVNLPWILADYNSGVFSSRNAELQYELAKLMGHNLDGDGEPDPQFVDGDFLIYPGPPPPLEKKSKTQEVVEAFDEKYSRWNLANIRFQLEMEKTKGFEKTLVYRAIRNEYESRFGTPLFGRLPTATVLSQKFGKDWSATIYADRAMGNFNSICQKYSRSSCFTTMLAETD